MGIQPDGCLSNAGVLASLEPTSRTLLPSRHSFCGSRTAAQEVCRFGAAVPDGNRNFLAGTDNLDLLVLELGQQLSA